MHKFKLDIPGNILDKELINFFEHRKWVLNVTNPIVEADFRQCNFLSPYGITLFAAYLLWLQQAKRKNIDISINSNSVAGNYLLEAGFYELFGKIPPQTVVVSPERTVKLTRISNSSEIAPFAAQVMEILQIEDEELEGAIRYSMIELLRNVVQHSSSNIGGIAMAQYYPSTGLVNLCIADTGVGIKKSLNEAYPEVDTDLQALKLATLPHVSRTFRPKTYSTMHDNAGLGLFFIQQIASLSGGSFFLGSKDALIDTWGKNNGEQGKLYKQARRGGWPGTFAYLQLRRDSISEFDAILTTCRRLAAEARKYPSELALDFIEEVPELDDLVVISVVEFEEDVDTAAKVRDETILPNVNSGKMVVLDFKGVKVATQSFVHALMYKVIRDGQHLGATLSIANCTNSTREAVMAVAAYAKITPE